MLITTNCSNLCCFIFDIQMIFNFEKSKHLCKMILNMFMGEIICSHMVWYWRVISGVVTEMGTCAVLLVPCAVWNCCWSSQQIDGLGHLVPKSKVHGTNMGPTWVLSAPCGPHVGPINLVIGVCCCQILEVTKCQFWWQPRWEANRSTVECQNVFLSVSVVVKGYRVPQY